MISGFENYDKEVRNLVKKIMEDRVSAYDRVNTSCSGLIMIGEKLKDDKLLAYGNYYMSEYYYHIANYEKSMEYGRKSLLYGTRADAKDIVARAYNIMGILYRSDENYAYAIENYLKSAEYAKKAGLFYEYAMVTGNIALLFFEIQDYEKSMSYYKESFAYYEYAKQNQFYYFNKATVLQSLAEIHVMQGEYDDAGRIVKQLLELISVHEEGYRSVDEAPIYMFISIYNHKIGKDAERDRYIALSVEAMKTEQYAIEIYETALKFCDMLLEINIYDEFENIMSYYKDCKDEEFQDGMMSVQRILMKYYLKMGKFPEYIGCSEAFLASYDNKIKNHNKDIKNIINLRSNLNDTIVEIDEIKEYSEKMRIKAETDELTDLANRTGYNNYSEMMFEKAYSEKSLYGVALIDVDFFKQYNDRYGHLKGDECLKSIAHVLLGEKNEHVYPARYGGDEFVIVFTGMEQRQIREVVKRIKQKVADLAIVNEDSKVNEYITLSQGAFVKVPNGQNKLWDFMSKADDVLYRVKKYGKNSYRVVDDFKKN